MTTRIRTRAYTVSTRTYPVGQRIETVSGDQGVPAGHQGIVRGILNAPALSGWPLVRWDGQQFSVPVDPATIRPVGGAA